MVATLTGERFVKVGGRYSFGLSGDDLSLLVVVNRVNLELGESHWHWDLTPARALFSFNGWVDLPESWGTWRPKFKFEGVNASCYSDTLEFEFNRPVVSTNYTPPFDARLACSVSPDDQMKIDPVRKTLNIYGFDYSTHGIETEATPASGPAMLQAEKQWAQGGDCFISVLTQRDISAISGRGKPTAWLHTESGFAYDNGGSKPYLAFVERGVEAEALYRQLDSDHIVEFSPYDADNILQENGEQLLRFRKECDSYRSANTRKTVGKVLLGGALVGLAIVGVAALASGKFNKK